MGAEAPRGRRAMDLLAPVAGEGSLLPGGFRIPVRRAARLAVDCIAAVMVLTVGLVVYAVLYTLFRLVPYSLGEMVLFALVATVTIWAAALAVPKVNRRALSLFGVDPPPRQFPGAAGIRAAAATSQRPEAPRPPAFTPRERMLNAGPGLVAVAAILPLLVVGLLVGGALAATLEAVVGSTPVALPTALIATAAVAGLSDVALFRLVSARSPAGQRRRAQREAWSRTVTALDAHLADAGSARPDASSALGQPSARTSSRNASDLGERSSE